LSVGDCLKKAYVLVYHSAPEPDRTDTLDAEKVVPGFDLDTTFFKSLRFQESNI
jgi:hypothetical protein